MNEQTELSPEGEAITTDYLKKVIEETMSNDKELEQAAAERKKSWHCTHPPFNYSKCPTQCQECAQEARTAGGKQALLIEERNGRIEQLERIGDIEDVKIIIKAKGKHWSIIPLEGMDREEARLIRIELMRVILQLHSIVDTPLEDVKEKLQNKK